MRKLVFINFILMLAYLPCASGFALAQADRKTKSKESGRVAAAEPGATSSSPLAFPFKRSWQMLTDSALSLLPSIDEERIYLALAGGRAVCLDRETGMMLWSSDPGGIISAPIAVAQSAVYIATRRIAEDGSESGASLRAVDVATGLTLWVRDYDRPFSSPLALAKDRIYVGSADGAFYALDAAKGEVVWKVETQDVVRGRALVTEQAIYFGSDDGSLRAVEPNKGTPIWKFQTDGKVVGRPAIDERFVYFGSNDGYVYSAELATGKLKWRSRTGAAVEASPVIAGDRLLVASFDNFVYALALANGDRIWKRRLESRISAEPVVVGDAAMIAPLRGDHIAVFLISDGRRVNLYQLDKGFEIVADPVFSGNTLLLATDKGLVVATTTQPAPNGTRATIKQ